MFFGRSTTLKSKQILAIQHVTKIICQNASKVPAVMLFCVTCMHWEDVLSNISKTSASVSSGFQTREKWWKHEAASCLYFFRVFETR